MAGRKNFVAGEILTAADVNSFLMDQSVMVFDDSAARGSAIPTPSEGMVTYLKDVNQVQAFTGAAFTPVGTILQVVSTTKTNIFSASVDQGDSVDITGLAVTITPTSTSSKVYVSYNFSGSTDVSAAVRANATGSVTRNGTPVAVGDSAGNRQRVNVSLAATSQGGGHGMVAASFLDEPNTTSALTYQVRTHNATANSGTFTIFVNRSTTDSDASSNARYASSITVMEVAG